MSLAGSTLFCSPIPTFSAFQRLRSYSRAHCCLSERTSGLLACSLSGAQAPDYSALLGSSRPAIAYQRWYTAVLLRLPLASPFCSSDCEGHSLCPTGQRQSSYRLRSKRRTQEHVLAFAGRRGGRVEEDEVEFDDWNSVSSNQLAE